MNPTGDKQMDEFTRAYIECALWAETDQNEEPLDSNYSIDDIAPETKAQMVKDCQEFQTAANNRVATLLPYERLEQAGHDFWLTRNHHGAGFWDGDWPEPAATILTEQSQSFGEFNLYAADGQVCH